MGPLTELQPMVRDVVEDARRHIQQAGFTIGEEAFSELSELALSGYRLMQDSRVLDLPAHSPERQRQEALARANLMRLIDSWLAIERGRGQTELTVGGFRRSYASICPIYPCGE